MENAGKYGVTRQIDALKYGRALNKRWSHNNFDKETEARHIDPGCCPGSYSVPYYISSLRLRDKRRLGSVDRVKFVGLYQGPFHNSLPIWLLCVVQHCDFPFVGLRHIFAPPSGDGHRSMTFGSSLPTHNRIGCWRSIRRSWRRKPKSKSTSPSFLLV